MEIAIGQSPYGAPDGRTLHRTFHMTLNLKYLLGGLLLLLIPMLAACGTAPSTKPNGTEHIYVLVLENEGYDQIVGSAKAPFLNSLIPGFALATNYTAVAHPSQPNYIALFSGSTQGISDDKVHDVNANNLADQLDAKGLSWRVYAQNVPPNCYTGATASGGDDRQGDYARKHNPAISFTDISGNPKRCANITDFSHFDPAAANFELIVPNLCNDMHDCGVSEGDAFVKDFLPRILQSNVWKDGGILFITWDEGSEKDNQGGGGKVPLLVLSSRLSAGSRIDGAFNHYSLLRTIQDLFKLECLNESCNAPSMSGLFKVGTSN